MEAVLLSYSEYEYLKNLEETFEQFEINDVLKSRLKNYDKRKIFHGKNLRKINA